MFCDVARIEIANAINVTILFFIAIYVIISFCNMFSKH